MVPPAHDAQASTVLRLNMQAPYYKWLVAGIVLLAEGSKTFVAAIGVIKTPNAIRVPEDTMVMSAQAATMIQP